MAVLCPECGLATPTATGACSECGTPLPEPDDEPDRSVEESPTRGSVEDDSSSEAPTSVFSNERRARRRAQARAAAAPLVPGGTFGTRYRILEKLGGGGMGVVYKAWDETLGIAVALKIIRPRVMRDPELADRLEQRFKRELLLARQVTHKNVVRIHDLGEIDGIKYITMTHVDGANLGTILLRDGKLSVPRALRIARQLVAGLRAAHEAGVIHRDLKPSNVMLDREDVPLIMDFGIARGGAGRGRETIQDAESSDVKAASLPGVTEDGARVGTVGYMAPEQASGREVDQRADLYALGLIFCEMLLGPDRRDALRECAEKETPSAHSIDPEIPEALSRVVARCLAQDVEARYQSAAEVEAELAGLDDRGHPLPRIWRLGFPQLATAGLVGAAAILGTWWFARTPPPPTELAPISVLIADFDNPTGDTVFEGSLEEALAVGIESASFVTSYPRDAALRLASEITSEDALNEEAARLISLREDIDIVLAGTIRQEGSGYSISVEVADPSVDEPVLVAEASASSKDQVLEAVASVATRIRRGLGDTRSATETEGGRETFTAGSLEAAHSYSIAQGLAMSYEDQQAIEHYERATELDPNFGRAYAGWGYSAFRLGRTEESLAAWEKAMALLDRMTDREKYRTLGLYYGTISRNYEKAIENYETLLSLYPSDDAGHNNLAMSYFSTRNFERAMEEGRRALEIYPTRLMYRVNYSLFAMYASDFATADSEAARILEDHPTFYDAYLPIAIAAIARSDFAAARGAYERLAESGGPGASLAAIGLADMAIYRARYDEAVDILTERISADRAAENQGFLAAEYIALAEAHQGDGERESSLAAAEAALALGRSSEVLLPTARIFSSGGQPARAQELARELESQLEPQRRAYAKIIQGEIALADERMVEALEAFQTARDLVDPWLARFDLGVLFVETGRYAEALSELELCERRSGEASAIFLDDIPTFRYMASLPYWLGRAQEGLGMGAAAGQSYENFLRLRPTSQERLVEDAHQRLEALRN